MKPGRQMTNIEAAVWGAIGAALGGWIVHATAQYSRLPLYAHAGLVYVGMVLSLIIAIMIADWAAQRGKK